MTRFQLIAIRLLLLALFLAAWETLPRNNVINPMLLPPLTDVLKMLVELLGRAQVHEAILVTAAEVIVAFVIAVPLGAVIGVLIAEYDYAGQIFKPLLFYVFSVPKSIFLPMFILIMGIGFQQKVAYAAFSTVFVVIMSATAAVESVKADHVLVARSYGATRMQILTRVYVPSMLPILLETLRISMIFNFTGVMIAEMYASRTGIGHLIANWGENFQLPQLFAGVLLLAAVAIAFSEPAGAAIEVAGLSHIYAGREGAVPALTDIAMTVNPGRFVVIVGPSGCGKTSLLMMMAGLRHQTSGTIDIQGRPIDAPDPDRVGVVFQEASLFPWLSALDNIEFPLALRHAPREERRARATEMLNLVGLQGFGARYPHELSGGMKQRVSIARGLVQDPPVLLMDEPFAALDEQTRMTMGDELLRIWAATGKTVVFVTHSLTEAVYLADEVIVMSPRPGRIVDHLQVSLPRPRTYEMLSGDTFGI